MIYIVEDDVNIRQMESYALKNTGYKVREFACSDAFFKECEKELPELVILDIMLPGENGLGILQRLKSAPQTKEIPVVMVTAKGTELDVVRGLDFGADDYIAKPFGIMEFISRVKARLRSTGNKPEEIGEMFSFKGIHLDDEKHIVYTDDEVCELTFKEYELLKLLLKNQGAVLARDKIMDRVWGFDYEGESRTIDMHIKTLRQKLGKYGEVIKTVRNVGYKAE